MKTCTVCKQSKPLDEFRTYSGRSVDGRRSLCKVCQREYEKEWRPRRTEARRASRNRRKEKDKAYKIGWLLENRAKYLVAECRRRCARKGLPFDLDAHIGDLQARINAGHCELSGIPFKKTMGPMTFDSPSLDRIAPAKGYIYSNIRVVCHAMNCALGKWGEEILAQVITGWMRKRGN